MRSFHLTLIGKMCDQQDSEVCKECTKNSK